MAIPRSASPLNPAAVATALGAYPRQRAVPCWFMRGGSSRGGYFLTDELPADPKERAALLLAAYGSPDIRQIDGIGGADALTSKAAIVGRSARPDADVDYTFVQVSIDAAQVGIGGNCGNMIAGVGPYAMMRGLVPVTEPETEVRIFTTNTGQVVTARIPVVDGMPAVDGACNIAGVPGGGARIALDFGDCAGAHSGRLLPTGNAQDVIDVIGERISVSLVDAATPFVFVRAAEIGAKGTETAADIAADANLSAKLERVRGWAAKALGMVSEIDDARKATPNVPRVMMVAPAQAYLTPDGVQISADQIDVCVRQMAMQKPHKALAVTGSVCAAVAAAVEGTVVEEYARGFSDGIRLGHPSGVLRVVARVSRTPDGGYAVAGAEIERTARLILVGTLFAPESRIAALSKIAEISGAKTPGD